MRRPEHELLLRCARLTLSAEDRAVILRLAATTIDWREVMRLAERHGLRPLLYRNLSDATAYVPRSVQAELWARHETLARRNRMMAEELFAILAAFEENGIRAVPYKGPTLAASVYGDVALREFGDLDILVPRRDVPAAKRALLARGYAGLHALSPAQEAALVRSQRLYEMGFFDANRRMLVEIHWQAGPEASTLALDDREWWAALDRMELEGRHVACLTKPEMLLVLCLHGTKHFWASLGWLVDLAEMVRDDNLDWKWLLARARQLGCERRIGLGLHLAASLLGANLPAQARAIAGDTEVARIGARIANSLFSAEFAPPSVLQAFQLNLRLCDRASQRVRRLWDSLMSPGLGEWERWPLPRALFFLYVPLRLARLARKYALPSWGPREHGVPTPARRP